MWSRVSRPASMRQTPRSYATPVIPSAARNPSAICASSYQIRCHPERNEGPQPTRLDSQQPHPSLPFPLVPHLTNASCHSRHNADRSALCLVTAICYNDLTELLALMNILIGLVVLGVIILVHEWGHFIVARLFGVRVDVFSIGFGPRLFGIKRGATDWRFSALPLGGYVRMAGQDITDIDSGDTKPTGAPDELLSKTRWQRALISFAGPAVNLIFPLLLLGIYYVAVGLPSDNALSKPIVITAFPAAQSNNPSSLRPGDTVVSINGTKNPTWEQALGISLQAAPGSTLKLQVSNNGATREVDVPSSTNPYARTFGYSPIPPTIGEVAIGTPADRAGLHDGDIVRAVDGQKIQFWDQFVDLVRSSGGKTLQLDVDRNGQHVALSVTPQKGIT